MHLPVKLVTRKETTCIYPELLASAAGVGVEVARGADLVNALLRTRFLTGIMVAPFEFGELAFESARGRLPTVFLGALALRRKGATLESVALTVDKAESELLLTSARPCVAEKLEQAESESSWLLFSELRACSGNMRAVGIDRPGPSPDASIVVASEFGETTAAVSGRWLESLAFEMAGSLKELAMEGLDVIFFVTEEALRREGDTILRYQAVITGWCE